MQWGVGGGGGDGDRFRELLGGLICRKRGEGEKRRGTSWSIAARKHSKQEIASNRGGEAVAAGDWRGEEKDGGGGGGAVSLA